MKFDPRPLAAVLAILIASAVLVAGAEAAPIKYVTDSLTADPGESPQTGAGCPESTAPRVVGGGVTSSGGWNDSVLTRTFPAPSSARDAWATEVDAFSAIAVTTVAACVGGSAADKLTIRTKDGNLPAAFGARKKITVECPPGYRATGGGVDLQANYGQVELEASRPVAGGTAWRGQARRLSGPKSGMDVSVICATGPFAKDLTYEKKTRTAESGEQARATAKCPGDAQVTSVGFHAGAGDSTVNSAGIATDGRSTNTWVDAGSLTAKFIGYAVCHK